MRRRFELGVCSKLAFESYEPPLDGISQVRGLPHVFSTSLSTCSSIWLKQQRLGEIRAEGTVHRYICG